MKNSGDIHGHYDVFSFAMATEFSIKVISLIQKIPKGKVATYGQIAAVAGKPQGARGVSWIIASSTKAHNLPWFRVIGTKGRISIPKGTKSYFEQIRRLKSEGVKVDREGVINLTKFQWNKKPPRAARLRRPDVPFGKPS